MSPFASGHWKAPVSGKVSFFFIGSLSSTPLCNTTVQCLSIFRLKSWKEFQLLTLTLGPDIHSPNSFYDLCALVFQRKSGWHGTGCDDEGY